jgi:tRNA uridine 5-carboxymethylaminomethyl modification enzyme
LKKLLKRPEIKYSLINKFSPTAYNISGDIANIIETNVKYEAIFKKQIEMAVRMDKVESKKIPEGSTIHQLLVCQQRLGRSLSRFSLTQ